MPLYVCDNCHAIDNTACGGNYWTKDMADMWPKEILGKALCVQCTPDHYADGSENPEGGKWHGRFPKRIASHELIEEIGREHFIHLGPFASDSLG